MFKATLRCESVTCVESVRIVSLVWRRGPGARSLAGTPCPGVAPAPAPVTVKSYQVCPAYTFIKEARPHISPLLAVSPRHAVRQPAPNGSSGVVFSQVGRGEAQARRALGEECVDDEMRRERRPLWQHPEQLALGGGGARQRDVRHPGERRLVAARERQERAAPLAHLGGELPTRAIGRGERGLR